jgi:hypothetical protein
MVLPEGTTAEIERVVGTMAEERPDAVLVTGEGDQYAHRQLIVELAGKTRLPALYATGDYVERGGLMGYVADDAEARRILVDDVHQIFTGVKPGDIPIYQNAKFDLVINLKTAKALGLTLPATILARADEVIERSRGTRRTGRSAGTHPTLPRKRGREGEGVRRGGRTRRRWRPRSGVCPLPGCRRRSGR